MDKKKIGAVLVVVVIVVYFLIGGDEKPKDDPIEIVEQETPVKKVEPTPTATPTPVAEPTVQVVMTPRPDESPLSEEDRKVKEDFEEALAQVNTEIDACRKELQGMVTEDLLDGELEAISNPESAMSLMGNYYDLMVTKFQTMSKLNQVVGKVMDSGLEMKDIGSKLLAVKDCGDFEEHSLLASIAEASSEYKWPEAEKKRITNYILETFKTQMKLEMGLPHVAIKIGALSEFVDSGLIDKKYKNDIERLIEKTQESQQTMQALLPDDHQIGNPVDKETSAILREREREEVNRLSDLLREVIGQLQARGQN